MVQDRGAQPVSRQLADPRGDRAANDHGAAQPGKFPEQETAFGLAKVVGAPRTYLRADTPPCPNDSAACRGRTYVVPGNIVLTGMTKDAYVCTFFPGIPGGSAGYVRHDELAPYPLPASLPLAAWNGTWRDGDNTIVLRADGGRLSASGEAYWPSANPSPKERPGGPNLGDLSGTATPDGNTVEFVGDPANCRVTLTLLPPYLLAVDHDTSCNGMNVSFTGVYRVR
jgi:hypothetical protein